MPAQPSAKLSGGRRGALSKPKTSAMESLIIDPNKLGQISLNRDAIQALTLAQAKVQVTISAGGTEAILVSVDTGKMIGGVDDVAKLMSLRSFVTREKKTSASSEVREQMVTAAYRISSAEEKLNQGYEQKTLDNSFVVAAKPLQSMVENVRSHQKSIKDNFGTSDEYKKLLTVFCQMTEKVLVDVIAAMVRGEKEKGLVDDLSIKHGLPAHVRNKLVGKSLAMTKDMDLSRVLFPADPSKGMALSVREWRSKEFLGKLGPLMVNSEIIATVIQEDELFLELIGMTAEQFANMEDPRVQRVLKMRILVVPPFEDHKRVLSLLEKQNFRGFGLPATAMDQSKDRLANLCAVPMRAYAFSVRMAETIPDFYDRILPAGTIKSPDERLGNYAKQCLTALEKGLVCDLIPIIRGEKKSSAMMAWICRECKIIPDGDLFKKIAKCLTFDEGDEELGLENYHVLKELPKPEKPLADVVTKRIVGSESAAVQDFEKLVFAFKAKGDNKKRQQAAASVLGKEAKGFLKQIAREHSTSLAESMEAYFRSFYSSGIQLAAVRIAQARFDEFDDDHIIEEPEDSSSDEDEEDA
jgi:hypothetical protein